MPKHSPAKERALRIGLGFRAVDQAAKRRNILTIAAVGVCVLWVLGSLVLYRSGNRQYSPGPISSAHANLNCSDCHAGGVAMRDATFLSGWAAKNEPATDAASTGDLASPFWHRKSDTLCQSCHPVANNEQQLTKIRSEFAKSNENEKDQKKPEPIPVSSHSDHQRPEAVDSCASCHAEHKGFKHLPSQVGDKSCLTCHQQLADSLQGEGTGIVKEVTGFEFGHPEFSSLQRDAGTLKFNHDLHMMKGLLGKGSNSSLAKTLASYPQHDGRLDGMVTGEGAIKLDCTFCHQPASRQISSSNSGAAGSSVFELDSADMTMPIYEQSCQVCHPLDLIPAAELDFVKKLHIEHAASAEKIANDLKVYLSLEALAPPELQQELSGEDIQVPADFPTRLWEAGSLPKEVPEKVRVYFKDAITKIRTQCVFCHLTADEDSGVGIPLVRGIGTSQPSQRGYVKTFESSWFKHAKFDHSAHRDMTCTDCHVMSGGKATKIKDGEDIWADVPMIKGLTSCTPCHRSGIARANQRIGPTDCNACHWYHRPIAGN